MSRAEENHKCWKLNKKQSFCLLVLVLFLGFSGVIVYVFINLGSIQINAVNITDPNATAPNNNFIKFTNCTGHISFVNESKVFEIDAKLILNKTNTYAVVILEVGRELNRREYHLCSRFICDIKISDKIPGRNITVRFTPAENLISCEWTLNESSSTPDYSRRM